MKKTLGFCLTTALAVACSTGPIYKSFDSLPKSVSPDYFLSFGSGDSLSLGVTFNQRMDVEDSNKSIAKLLRKIGTKIYANDKLIDSLVSKSIKVSKKADGDEKVIISVNSESIWKKPKFINANTLKFHIVADAGDVIYETDKNIADISQLAEARHESPLKLTPRMEIIGDSAAYFYVEAQRIYNPVKEYLPNSETIRLEIFSGSGMKRLFSSDKDKNYFQVIKKVLPEEIGNKYDYKIYWNGKDDGGNNLEPGIYEVRLIIPALPDSYSTQLRIEWRLKK
jgi:hypothetical protein